MTGPILGDRTEKVTTVGLPCPKCNFRLSQVLDTRYKANYTIVRRRRQCNLCSYRFSTEETLTPEYRSQEYKDQCAQRKNLLVGSNG